MMRPISSILVERWNGFRVTSYIYGNDGKRGPDASMSNIQDEISGKGGEARRLNICKPQKANIKPDGYLIYTDIKTSQG